MINLWNYAFFHYNIFSSDLYCMTVMIQHRSLGATHTFYATAEGIHFYLNYICQLRGKITGCSISLLIWKCIIL